MQRFKNILCVVGSSPEGHPALERAVMLAENNQARVTVVKVIEKLLPNTRLLGGALSPEDLQAKIATEHLQGLIDLVAPSSKNIEIQTKVHVGIPFLEIIHEVLRNRRDLVIKTAGCGELLHRTFGTDDMHLLRKCPCPVWLVESKSPKAYHRILAAVDVDDYYPPEELNTRHLLNIQILEMATSLALSEFAELHIVHAWEAIGESAMRGAFLATPEDKIVAYVEEVRQRHKQKSEVLMDEIINKLGQNALDYLKPQTHLLKGSPRKKVSAFAEEIKADLVVIGTVARTGIPGFFMGNTVETILNQLNCSVLAIKPPGFETPVTLED